MSTLAGARVTRDGWIWTVWAVGALLLLPVLGDVADGVAYGVAVALTALVLAAADPAAAPARPASRTGSTSPSSRSPTSPWSR